jgi:hypothetical protein
VRVSSPPAGGEAASPATDVGRTPTATPPLQAPPNAHGFGRALPPTARPHLFNVRILSSSLFQKHASCNWRFLRPFQSALLATRVSFSLSIARFLQLVFLAAFPERASCDARFLRPFQNTLLATGVSLRLPFRSRLLTIRVSFSLSTARFLRHAFLSVFLSRACCLQLAFLLAFQEHTSCHARFFQPFNRTFLSANAHFLRHFSRPTCTYLDSLCYLA